MPCWERAHTQTDQKYDPKKPTSLPRKSKERKKNLRKKKEKGKKNWSKNGR